jgi:hypothetical protein
MNPPIHDAAARQHSGGPLPVPGRRGTRTNRSRNPDIHEIDRRIAELVDRSTQELRLAWRQLHRTGPPQGLSRDLLIRALANQLQEQSHGGKSPALQRRLLILAAKG